MQAADQAGFIGIEADRHQVDLEVFGLEQDVGARDREFADPALPKTAADHDAFGVGPGLGLEKPPRHIGQFLREFLDRAVHQGGGVDVVTDQRLIQLGLGEVRGGLLAERIVAIVLQGLAQRIQDLAERALAGAIAEKAVIVLQFDIEAVHLHGRQTGRAVAGDARCRYDIFSHFCPCPVGSH